MAKKIILNINGSHNGFEYVDLGLPSGTMWATCNVGADSPFDYGLLFQFGRVDGYRYGDENNKFKTNEQNVKDKSISEYIPITTSLKTYCASAELDLKDDAAHVNMGGKWRMPTEVNYSELFINTTRTLKIVNGVKGMMFVSKINNKQLFVPFGGYWYDNVFFGLGSSGRIWSSWVLPSYEVCAWELYCNYSCDCNIHPNFRTYALSVRGVFKK